jgi:hypothetical protein
VIDPKVGRLIRKKSLELSKVFGCDDPPLVYPEDFRKTLARLSVAYAVLDVSANEDFTQLIVKDIHVLAAAMFIDIIYKAENCRLDAHAATYRQSYGLEDLDNIKEQIDEILALEPGNPHRYRFERIMAHLLRSHKKERIRKGELADEFDVVKKVIQKDMQWFVKNHLVNPNIQTGYSPLPRLFKLIGRLQKLNPEKYGFDDAKLPDEYKEEGTDGH